jgi:glycosyltransferase involved in cell wall biosynthesis
MKLFLYGCFLVLSWNLELFSREESVKFAIVIPSYNNEKWCIENIESCVRQTYKNFIIIYVDDCSTDKTGLLIDEYVKSHNLEDKIFVIHNQRQAGCPLANFYKVIHALDPHCVVVNVDGDDKLMHTRVLEKLSQVYQDPNIWLTYGEHAADDPSWFCHTAPLPPEVIKNKSYRSYRFVSGHLRTYYAGLFQRIKKEDLLFHDGNFFPRAGDVALMLPMLEMASPNHFKYLDEVLYWYRTTNPLSEFKSNHKLTIQCIQEIRAKPSYPSLTSLFPETGKNFKLREIPKQKMSNKGLDYDSSSS